MLTVSKFSDITRLADKLDKPTCIYLQQRFKQLHKTYCSNGSVPLERFCLHDYGEILIAEQFSEINISAYECIEKINLDSTVIYCATWVRNNDICDDVIIPQSILTADQLNLLEKEL